MKLDSGILLKGRYRIVSILAQGGMGAVYRAHDENLNIAVAVKENLFLSEEYSAQFQREAMILANVKQINLPRVIDYFIEPGRGEYLVMDYIEGEDLRQRIDRISYLPQIEAIIIGIEISNALDYLHTRKPPVIHRDIKPGNIKITPASEIYLVDFGLAKIFHETQSTMTGARAMTPGFSPPEQYGTARTDARTDIYSLGATLYTALSGIIPEDALARATGKTSLTSLRHLQPKVDNRVIAIVEKCLAIEPEDRYQSAIEVKNALLDVGKFSHSKHVIPAITPPPQNIFDNQPPSEKLPQDDIHISPGRSNNNIIKKYPLYFFLLIFIVGIGVWVLTTQNNFVFQIFERNSQNLSPSIATPISTITNTPLNSIQPSKTVTTIELEKNQITTTEPLITPTPNLNELFKTPQPTLLGGGSGEISFVSKRTGIYQIWNMNSDGTNQHQLTSLTGGGCQPDWSPDGKKLALISPCNGKDIIYPGSKIYILNQDGSEPTLLPVSQPGDFDPAWSPDGNRLAFSSIRNGYPHIFVYDFDKKSLSELSDTRFSDIQPAWSPGGKQIAIARKNLYYHIWIISDTGQTQFQFSSNGDVNDFWPVWSDDNDFILYGRSKDTPYYPWLIRMDYADRGTGRETRIPALNETDFGPMAEPDISPNQEWFIYEGWPDGKNHDIYLKPFDSSSQPIRLTNDPEMDFNPVWKPSENVQ